MEENLTIDRAIEILIYSNERNLQFDFFRSNGEVLLQVFKSKDIPNLNIKFDIKSDSGIVFHLIFHPDKTNNNQNFKRFEKSKLSNYFDRVEFYNQNAYFYELYDDLRITSVKAFLIQTLNTIYKLDLGLVNFTLNAY